MTPRKPMAPAVAAAAYERARTPQSRWAASALAGPGKDSRSECVLQPDQSQCSERDAVRIRNAMAALVSVLPAVASSEMALLVECGEGDMAVCESDLMAKGKDRDKRDCERRGAEPQDGGCRRRGRRGGAPRRGRGCGGESAQRGETARAEARERKQVVRDTGRARPA